MAVDQSDQNMVISGQGIGLIIYMKDDSVEDSYNPGHFIPKTLYGTADFPSARRMLRTLNCHLGDNDCHCIHDPNRNLLLSKLDEILLEVNTKNSNGPKVYHFLCVIYIGHGNCDQGGEYLCLRDGSQLYVKEMYIKFSAQNCPGLVGDLKAFV